MQDWCWQSRRNSGLPSLSPRDLEAAREAQQQPSRCQSKGMQTSDPKAKEITDMIQITPLLKNSCRSCERKAERLSASLPCS